MYLLRFSFHFLEDEEMRRVLYYVVGVGSVVLFGQMALFGIASTSDICIMTSDEAATVWGAGPGCVETSLDTTYGCEGASCTAAQNTKGSGVGENNVGSADCPFDNSDPDDRYGGCSGYSVGISCNQ
jgi:hypothetical protein